MTKRYIAFDVETPNYANDRMSAIGITVIDNGFLTNEYYSLVNPEARFDYFNINLTGIRPEDVVDKPCFPELWNEIKPLMESGVLIAHNAPFDMGVLSKCLKAYGIPWNSNVPYACTCSMGRACYPEMYNHKLDTMCSKLDIDLDHHNAGSDSRACAKLLLNYMNKGLNINAFIRRYNLA